MFGQLIANKTQEEAAKLVLDTFEQKSLKDLIKTYQSYPCNQITQLVRTCRGIIPSDSPTKLSADGVLTVDFSKFSEGKEDEFHSLLTAINHSDVQIKITNACDLRCEWIGGTLVYPTKEKWFGLFCDALAKNQKIKTLHLSMAKCELDANMASCLSENLAEKLTSLDVDQNDELCLKNGLGAEGAKALSTCKKLTSLRINGNKLGDEGAKYLNNLTELTCLHIGSNELTDAGVKALRRLTKLESLDISNCKLGKKGATSLKTLVESLEKLTSLNIASNKLGPKGTEVLSGSLTKLKSLNISSNNLGKEGIKHLEGLTELTWLNVHYNKLGNGGVAPLNKLTKLVWLDLSSNDLLPKDTEALTSLTELTGLNVSLNRKLGNTGVEHLRELKRLTSLNVCQIGIEGIDGVRPLSLLTELTHLDIGFNSVYKSKVKGHDRQYIHWGHSSSPLSEDELNALRADDNARLEEMLKILVGKKLESLHIISSGLSCSDISVFFDMNPCDGGDLEVIDFHAGTHTAELISRSSR